MIYICPVKSCWNVTTIIFAILANFELFHIQEIKEVEIMKVLKTVDLESGEFPVVFTSHECTETDVVEHYQTTLEVHDIGRLGFPTFKKEDQIIILGNVAHILITLIENF
jgi:hypothetical protein